MPCRLFPSCRQSITYFACVCAQYTLINRSEQLRIIFFSLSAVASLASPWLAQELFPSDGSIDALSSYAAAAGATALFSFLAYREKASRGAKLRRLEREFELADFTVEQPPSALAGRGSTTTLLALRDKRRVVVVYGSAERLEEMTRAAAIYRRRFTQSGVVLVPVPASDVSKPWPSAAAAQAEGWLWKPRDEAAWRDYFTSLLSGRVDSVALGSSGAWLALSLKGRSCGSGLGLPPWDELLGTKLPPLRRLSADEAAVCTSAADAAVLAEQAKLYDALSRNDAEAVQKLFLPEDDEEVARNTQQATWARWARCRVLLQSPI
uniref:Uncharacterized protein n=1 Tax=Chrysotila carterae TaxID=13221 RepID=A0A7S4EXI5_CHRCT